MKNSIKRAQSRAGSSFAERENFRPKVKQLKKTLLTLVALLAVTTGAWAQTETLLTTITATAKEQASYSTANVATVSFSYTAGGSSAYLANWGWWGYGWTATVTAAEGYTITKCVFYDDAERTATDSEAPFVVETTEQDKTPKVNGTPILAYTSKGIKKIEVYGYVTPTPSSGPEVAWTAAENTGTFNMPGGNVTLEPEYYPQATVADGGVTAADADARATTDDPLVKVDATKLTGAKKLMYFVSNSGTTAPAYDAGGWTDQLPTAEGFTQQGSVYVWYYPVGTDEGVDGATATYSDGDICLESITARIAAAPTYAVTFAEGVNPEPPAEPEWTAEPNAGVTKGQTVTVTYTGSRKVIGVKAEKKASTPSLNITSPVVGQVIGSDGKNYAAANVPSGVDKVAMIAYVNGSNGLAIALADEGLLDWATAKSTCEAKTPAFNNGTWKLPTKDEWKQMFSANGGNEEDYDGLNTAITTAGGTALPDDGTVYYWSSSEYDSDRAYTIEFYYGYASLKNGWKTNERLVRAVLAF